MRDWKRTGLTLLLVVLCALAVRTEDLGPGGKAHNERGDEPPMTVAEVSGPEAYAGVEAPGGGNGEPVDLVGLSRLCGENLEEFSLTGWVEAEKGDSTLEGLRSMVGQAAQPLEESLLKDGNTACPAGNWTTVSAEGARGVDYLRWLGKDCWVESWARSTDCGDGPGGMTYLVLRFTGLAGPQLAALLNQVVRDSLHRLGNDECTSMEVICWREGALDEQQMSALVSQVLAQAGAEELGRLRQDDSLVITAFSPLILERSDKGGEPVNLQLAARYRPRDNRTYFHLGVPRIMEEY